MTTDTELIAYLEARSKRRLLILGGVLVALLAIGGIAFVVNQPTKEDIRNQRTQEVLDNLTNND